MEISSSPWPEKCSLKADMAFLKRSVSVSLECFFMALVHKSLMFNNNEHSNIMNICQELSLRVVPLLLDLRLVCKLFLDKFLTRRYSQPSEAFSGA